MSRVTLPLQVYLVDNVPFREADQESIIDVDITLANASGVLTFEKLGTPSATKVSLVVSDLTILGLSRQASESEANLAVKHLVTAINLASDRAVFTRHERSPRAPAIDLDNQPPAPVQVERTSSEVRLVATATLRVRASVSARLQGRINLDETHALNAYSRLRKVTVTDHSLIKAIKTYDEACNAFDVAGSIKDYGAAIEIAVNSGGLDLDGQALDSECARLTGLPLTIFEQTRVVYNRSKHADQTPRQRQVYEDAMTNIGETARNARKAANAVLAQKLPR